MLQSDIILNEFAFTTHTRRGAAGHILYESQRPPPPNVNGVHINCTFTYSWHNNFTAALQFIDAVLCTLDTLSVFNSRGQRVVGEFVESDTCEELYIDTFTEYSKDGRLTMLLDIILPSLPNRTLKILYAGKKFLASQVHVIFRHFSLCTIISLYVSCVSTIIISVSMVTLGDARSLYSTISITQNMLNAIK